MGEAGGSRVLVRRAVGTDFAATERIESAADALLIEWLGASTWWPAMTAAQRAACPGFTVVACVEGGSVAGGSVAAREVVGFGQVIEADGHAHLEQVSVLPAFGRQGIGRRLVDAAADLAREHGHRELTLRTFAAVPFNAPFYTRCGFTVSEPGTDFHRGLVETEQRLGLTALGDRVQMTKVL